MNHRRIYGIWIAVLAALVAAGILYYVRQLTGGLGLTGMSRDVTWGLYIGQFLFAEGIAASSAVLFLYDGQAFRKVALFGVLIAVAGVIASMLFIVADMGQPSRLLNVLTHAAPGSLMFWDMLSLTGYLVLNIVIGAAMLDCEHKETPMPVWIRPLIRLSVPWAIGMQTVAAFLYCGLPGRSFWLTAILAPRFMASALASGAAVLILALLCMGGEWDEVTRTLARQMSYAMGLNIFFILLELFTAFYGGVLDPIEHFRYLLLQPWMWASMILAVASLILPRRNVAMACGAAIVSLWMDKGFAMVIGGFVPSPDGSVTGYLPTLPEITIAAGIWAIGALVATGLLGSAIAFRAGTSLEYELLARTG